MKLKEFLKGKSKVDEIFSKVPVDINVPGPARDLEALRTAVMAEYDAINLYDQLAQQVRNQKIKRTLLDIAQEEKVHVGEFEQLLREFDKEHKESEIEGSQEVEEI